VFILVPLLTGLLAYNWLPNESYNPATDRVIASHDVDVDENGQDRTETVYDVWQNVQTGKIHRLTDFERHRRSEQWRMTYTWFMYGLIGCVFYAFYASKVKGRQFVRSLVLAVLLDFVVATFTFLMQMNTSDRIASGT